MGYLVLSRREGEGIYLSVDPGADPATVLEQLKAGVYIDLTQISGGQARIGIEAPSCLQVLRCELLDR